MSNEELNTTVDSVETNANIPSYDQLCCAKKTLETDTKALKAL